MHLRLHHLHMSRSTRIIWLLEELGLDYERIDYHRDPVTRRAPDSLRDVHPLGKAPVLEVDGVVIAESGAIIEYLLETHGAGRLAPSSGTGRAEFRLAVRGDREARDLLHDRDDEIRGRGALRVARIGVSGGRLIADARARGRCDGVGDARDGGGRGECGAPAHAGEFFRDAGSARSEVMGQFTKHGWVLCGLHFVEMEWFSWR